MKSHRGTISVKPVLFCAPVFWGHEFWARSAHAWDWVKPETPLADKPWAEVEVSLDVTMGEVFAVACDAWGITEGPDFRTFGATRQQEFHRFAFVRPEQDARGLSAGDGRRWPSTLPIAGEDGSVDQTPALSATYRELLTASELGLLEGDVMRPYVHPVRPQGGPGDLIDAGRLTVEAIRAAYAEVDAEVGFAEHTLRLVFASLPAADHAVDKVVDEGVRVGAVVAAAHWARKRLRKPKHPD